MARKTFVRWTLPVLAALSACCWGSPACAADADIAAAPYALGQGWRLGQSGVTIGGYGSLEVQRTGERAAHPSLAHASAFVWWEGESRWKFFAEVDNQANHTAEHETEPGESRYVSVERIYVDYTLNDRVTLRAGKYLTPIGRWNQNHADPLVWTTSRPLITRDLFPDNATGVMALGSLPALGRQASYSVFASTGKELRPDPAEDEFKHSYGARLNVPLGEHLQAGLSYAGFSEGSMRPRQHRLLGFDFVWAANGIEVSGEALYRRASENTTRAATGGFVQLVVPLWARLSAAGRFESVSNPLDPDVRQRAVLGLNWRSNRAMSLKLELVRDSGRERNAPIGLLSSISVLF
ncbi:hypothetical protein [Massilia sp. PWRC2]|uniref:hypothetical protein n=1 Tax=Massilia sp. PWRC2 TaxID=2804626 RepID=UPI003CF7F123